MMIGEGLLTDIKEMIEVAGRKGNTVVTSDDSNSGVSENGNRNSDDYDDDDDGKNENDELSLALIGHTRKRQSDQPRTSFVEPPRRRKTIEFVMIEGQPQQQEKVAIEMTEERRRWIGQESSFLLTKKNSDSNSNDTTHFKDTNATYDAKSFEGPTSHNLRDSSVDCNDLVGDDCELGEFV
jgi:hypothetical protein